MKLLNIACGSLYHKDWVNIDFHAPSSRVLGHNILKGLPFEKETFDVAYSSHFLEHLTEQQSLYILREAHRVLRKNGIIRIVVPDLANICQEYLRALAEVDENPDRYRWTQIELIDQMVRNSCGGEMGKIFRSVIMENKKELYMYITQRIGNEIKSYKSENKNRTPITINKIKNQFIYMYLYFIKNLIPSSLRSTVWNDVSIGELHKWMYDKHSLKSALENAGFANCIPVDFNTSNIDNFNSYLLDSNKDLTPRKGIGSLYMEAYK